MSRTPLTLTAVLAATLLATACVPTTTGPVTESGPAIVQPGPIDTSTAYLATADNGFDVPAVPVEQVPETYRRQIVAYETEQVPGTIVINPAQRVLYFVTSPTTAIRYGIAVGRAGFEWSGEAVITERKTWPTWTPPPEMIERKPELEEFKEGQPGGPTNPLGARALYLTTNGVDYGYRIHGTPEWNSIGSNASSGCIRMINQDVMDLYNRVPAGAKVIVMNADGTMPTTLTLPPPQPKKEKPRQTTRRTAPAPDPVVVEPAMPALPVQPPLDVELVAPATPAVTPQPAVVTPAPVTPAPVAPAPVAPAPVIAAPATAAPVTPAPAVAPAVTTPAPVCLPTEANPCPAP